MVESNQRKAQKVKSPKKEKFKDDVIKSLDIMGDRFKFDYQPCWEKLEGF